MLSGIQLQNQAEVIANPCSNSNEATTNEFLYTSINSIRASTNTNTSFNDANTCINNTITNSRNSDSINRNGIANTCT